MQNERKDAVRMRGERMDVIKQINDVDFGIIDTFDGKMIGMKTVHGDILIVKGAIEDDADALMTFGVIDGEQTARVAFYKPIDEIKQMVERR